MVKALISAIGLMAASWLSVRPANAGCICPSLSKVSVGDLAVHDATIAAQRWTVSPDGVELELELRSASAKTTIDVLAMGIPSDELAEFLDLAKLNHELICHSDPERSRSGGICSY